MSIHDRDWYREEPRERWSLAGLAPKWSLVGGTALAFLVQEAIQNGTPGGERLLYHEFALSLRGVEELRLWQVLSYALLHSGVSHFLWNMVALWFVATVLEDHLPRGKVLLLYAAGAAGGALGHLAWLSAGPAPATTPVVGASGAVMALLVHAALRSPSRRVLFFFLEIPLWVVGTIYVAKDLLEAALGTAGTVAVQAHLGGAAAGAAAWFASSRGRAAAGRRAACPECGKALARDGATCGHCGWESGARPGVAEAAESARVDALLARIHAEGMTALSEEERDFLRRVSQRYRGRR